MIIYIIIFIISYYLYLLYQDLPRGVYKKRFSGVPKNHRTWKVLYIYFSSQTPTVGEKDVDMDIPRIW